VIERLAQQKNMGTFTKKSPANVSFVATMSRIHRLPPVRRREKQAALAYVPRSESRRRKMPVA
jgi:hypothetical protein